MGRLRRVARELGFPPVRLWARAYGKDLHAHLHIYASWPSQHLDRLVRELVRLTGDVQNPHAAGKRGFYAGSDAGGWLIAQNYRRQRGCLDGADYIAKQDGTGKATAHFKDAFGMTANINAGAQRKVGWNISP